MRSRGHFWIGLIALAVGGSALAAPEEPSPDKTWYVLKAGDDAKLGYGAQDILKRRDGRDIVETISIKLQNESGALTEVSQRTVRSEDDAGQTVSIISLSKTGDFQSRAEAYIADGKARVVRTTPHSRTAETIALPAGARFDDGAALLQNWDWRAKPTLAFEAFDAGAMAVEHITIELQPSAPSQPITAVRHRYAGRDLIGIAKLTLGYDGAITEVAQPMFGAIIRSKTTDRATALASYPPYRVLPHTMMKSPFRISASAQQGHIRYRVSFKDGLSFALPQTSEQRVTTQSGAAFVDICLGCGPGLPSDAQTLADALKPTAWLQSDNPQIRRIAAPIAQLRVSDARKMEMLREKARPYIETLDFVGHYSAVDTLRRRAGDCTEAAVLLAALGRAAGIPTRVVNGMTYSRQSYHGVSNAFMPHSWTLAYVDGGWRSFDLALDAFDSTHIALSIGDGDARSVSAAGQFAGLIRIDDMAEIRNAPE